MSDHYVGMTSELVEQKKGGYSKEQRAPMPTPKISFGCCVDGLNEYFYTVGGLEAKDVISKECTAYSIQEDKWQVLPQLQEPLYSTSCIVFNSEHLYAIGGTNSAHKETKVIQRLNLADP